MSVHTGKSHEHLHVLQPFFQVVPGLQKKPGADAASSLMEASVAVVVKVGIALLEYVSTFCVLV